MVSSLFFRTFAAEIYGHKIYSRKKVAVGCNKTCIYSFYY